MGPSGLGRARTLWPGWFIAALLLRWPRHLATSFFGLVKAAHAARTSSVAGPWLGHFIPNPKLRLIVWTGKWHPREILSLPTFFPSQRDADHSALGCEERATLGKSPRHKDNSEGVPSLADALNPTHSVRHRRPDNAGASGLQLLRSCNSRVPYSQGSSFLATLGYLMASPSGFAKQGDEVGGMTSCSGRGIPPGSFNPR